MHTLHKQLNAWLILITVVISGCATNLTPMEVSDKFWLAEKNRDNQSIKKYILAGSVNKDNPTENLLMINNYSLGRTVIDKDQAWVDTTVEIGDSKPFSVPIKTVLLKENNQWKVDYEATVSPISSSSDIARFLGSLNELGIEFADKLNRSLGQLQNELPEIQKQLENIEENMKQKLPELQERMEEFLRQLEEALGGKPANKGPQGTTEI